jgi:hypothetical protein
VPRIYNRIPQTNHVYRAHRIADILQLQFTLHVMLFPTLNVLYFHNSTFSTAQNCCLGSALVCCFPGTFLRYFLNDFAMLTVTPVTTGITFIFTFHMRRISVVFFLISVVFVFFRVNVCLSSLYKHCCNRGHRGGGISSSSTSSSTSVSSSCRSIAVLAATSAQFYT